MRVGKQEDISQYSGNISEKNELNIQKCHKELMLLGGYVKFMTFHDFKSCISSM